MFFSDGGTRILTRPGKPALLAVALLTGVAGLFAGVMVSAADQAHEEIIQPSRIWPLMGEGGVGRNDSRPRWSPDGTMVSFERTQANRQEIVIAAADGRVVKRVYYSSDSKKDSFGLGSLLPGVVTGAESYNAGLAWAPDAERIVFMSNAGQGNYDLYMDAIHRDGVIRLTFDNQKDGQPDWHPARDEIAFVSGRAGSAGIYRIDLNTRKVSTLNRRCDHCQYPRWSPAGDRLVMMREDRGSHDIVLVEDNGRPDQEYRRITSWSYDDISPSWSPDGSKLAFYSNYTRSGAADAWNILVVDAGAGDGEQPGEVRVIAEDVLPDAGGGPSWSPDGRSIAWISKDSRQFNPIYVTDVATGAGRRVETGTRMNRDVRFSHKGTLAFSAQVEQWDRIFIAELGAGE